MWLFATIRAPRWGWCFRSILGILENRDSAPVGLMQIGWSFFAKGDTLRWEIAPLWGCSDAVILRFRTQDSIETLVANISDQIASPRLVNPQCDCLLQSERPDGVDVFGSSWAEFPEISPFYQWQRFKHHPEGRRVSSILEMLPSASYGSAWRDPAVIVFPLMPNSKNSEWRLGEQNQPCNHLTSYLPNLLTLQPYNLKTF